MSKEKLNLLKTKYGTWKNVGEVLNVSTRTIRYWRSNTYKPSKKHKENITKHVKYNYKKHRKMIKKIYRKKIFKFYDSNKYGTITRRIDLDTDLHNKSKILAHISKIDDFDVHHDRVIFHTTVTALHKNTTAPLSISMDVTNLTQYQIYDNIEKIAYKKAYQHFNSYNVELRLNYSTIEYTRRL